MAKKILFSLMLFALMSFQVANAQVCQPDPQYTQPGVYPDSVTGLPCAIVDSSYSVRITVIVPADTQLVPLPAPPVPIDSAVLAGPITGLPVGISYFCEPPSCSWAGGTAGCILITGTPQTQGIFNIVATVDSYIGGSPTPSSTTVVDYYSIVVTDTANCTLTGIKEIDASKLAVIQNNPNPFSDKTEISFTTAKTGIVKFKVYNVLGKLVYSENINAKAGANTIEFFTNYLPAGIYMYGLRDDKQGITRRMVIVSK